MANSQKDDDDYENEEDPFQTKQIGKDTEEFELDECIINILNEYSSKYQDILRDKVFVNMNQLNSTYFEQTRLKHAISSLEKEVAVTLRRANALEAGLELPTLRSVSPTPATNNIDQPPPEDIYFAEASVPNKT